MSGRLVVDLHYAEVSDREALCRRERRVLGDALRGGGEHPKVSLLMLQGLGYNCDIESGEWERLSPLFWGMSDR